MLTGCPIVREQSGSLRQLERARQQCRHRGFLQIAVQVGQQHRHRVIAKFGHDLAAGAARADRAAGIGDYGQGSAIAAGSRPRLR